MQHHTTANRRKRDQFVEDLRFLKSWASAPLRTGAVSPSSRELANRMAQEVDPDHPGILIELGPGTGVITRALIERGFDASRLVLVEFNPKFCRILKEAFPGVTVLRGDAYQLRNHLRHLGNPQLAGVVTGLPLFTRPLPQRVRLINDCLEALDPGKPIVQFSYALVPPVPMGHGDYTIDVSKWVWRNLPPARVWTYRRPSA
ncbi:MAG: phospholipid methyltransferase [Rhodobiaceae bacterium]|nr:phospholipid methyltransferase [Rhodobiaceae bacterium]MCC0012612.1 phospholipid methyltransferase [Rhodobiaceae bacterium]MCC0050753.1 phospholipid methyltransferase [Rhodobiaceae bacterium]MCC0061819.1 phospholipid methyltransferase [Rhodobiaceae bacterium]